MRKTCILFLLASVIATSTGHPHVHADPQESREKLANDALLTTLSPSITEAIIKHYGYPKQYALFWSKVLEIKRTSEGGYSFNIKVEVMTFEHAHSNPYGTETITFHVSPSGVKLIHYEHKADEWESKIAIFEDEVL